MATKALARKIFVNPQAFSMIGVFGRIDTRSAVPVHFSGISRTRIKDRGGGDVELWNKKDEHKRLLQEVEEGLPKFRRSLVSIELHRGSGGGGGGGEEGIIEFTTASSVRRLALQRPGPYGLQRQAVNGVVCITTKDAFLLYNLTTGDTSPWIETTTCSQPLEGRRQVDSIALGFDPRSNKHKVVCISSSMEKTKDGDEAERLVVEVLTVRGHTWTSGEHKWRILKIVPPTLSKVGRFASFVDGPLYVGDRIHWHFNNVGTFEYFLHFHVGSESFSCALLPWRLDHELVNSSRHGDSSIHIRTLLMEVDENVAILKSSSDVQGASSLWIRYVLSPGTFEWREEKVCIPYTYVCPGSSIETLTGTHFIFIQSHDGNISYYNRRSKVSTPLRIPTSPIPDNFVWGRIVKF